MQNFKKILTMIFLSGLSNLLHAAYREDISLERPDIGQVAEHFSDMPSSGAVSRQDVYANSNTMATQTRLFAEISNDPLPYVHTEVKQQAVNDIVFDVSIGGRATASIYYDFFLEGTPNTSLALNVASLYSSRVHIEQGNFSNVSYLNSPFSYSELELAVLLNDLAGETLLDYVHNCNGMSCHYSYNLSGEGYIQPISTKVNGVEITPFEFKTTQSTPTHTINGLLESSLLVRFDDSGSAFGRVFLSSRSVADTISDVSGYIDPFFSIDPSYLAQNPNTTLSFTPGVGNANPLAPVPEPQAYAMILLGLGFIGCVTRRKS